MAFGGILRQSTAVDVLIGPFLDDTNGKDAKTLLTIEDEHVLLSKNGQALTAKTDANNAAHDALGNYNCPLGTTDTNTCGQLALTVHMAGALPVRFNFQIVEESIYDAVYATNATLSTNVGAIITTLGAVVTAAATGDPSADKTIISYVKQLVNILIGSSGIAAFPAEAAPANAVSLAEVIRAIHADVTGLNGADMRGTDGAALASAYTVGRR